MPETSMVDDDPNVVKYDLYNAHEGSGGRTPGVYLDQVERQEAEVDRARREGRRPKNLDKPELLPLAAGSMLTTKPNLVDSAVTAPSTEISGEPGVKPYVEIQLEVNAPEETDFTEMAQRAREQRANADAILDEADRQKAESKSDDGGVKAEFNPAGDTAKSSKSDSKTGDVDSLLQGGSESKSV